MARKPLFALPGIHGHVTHARKNRVREQLYLIFAPNSVPAS